MSGIINLTPKEILVSENNAFAIFRVSRTGGSLGSGSIEYSTADGTATAGEDYEAISGTLFFGPGILNRPLEIPILNDNVFEGNETFSIAIGNEQGDIDLGVTRTAIVTIEDEDVADSNALVFEQDSYSILENQSEANIRIRRLGNTSTTATVDFSTSEDSADTDDYTNISLTVEFLPGETYKDVNIPINDDQLPEPDERLILSLQNPTGIEIQGRATSTLTITDNDPIPYTFDRETIVSDLIRPTSFDWSPEGDTLFITEQKGVVKVLQDGILLADPFWDGTEIVNASSQRGLLSIAIHPEFPVQPYVYLGFTIDRPGQTPDTRDRREAEVIRVTADPTTNYTTAIADSSVTLLTISEGGQFHATGDLKFGPDGMLYYTHGDGQNVVGDINRPDLLWSLERPFGKQFRIDPITGNGLSDNPFYDGDPSSLTSKVLNLGLRNPFRFTFDPETNEPVIGDVGWRNWEEVNIGTGLNFGWPYFEGGNIGSLRAPGIGQDPDLQDFYNSEPPVTAPLYALPHEGTTSTSIILGEFYSEYDQYPALYHDRLFLLNSLTGGDIYALDIDRNSKRASAVLFARDVSDLTQLSFGQDGKLYTVDLQGGVIERWEFNDQPQNVIPNFGSNNADLIKGLQDEDKIFGLGGADTIFGGNGDDTIFGGEDLDSIFGGTGADSLFGGAGGDYIFGLSGEDTIVGGDENDTVFGGDSADVIYGQTGADFLFGGIGDDILRASSGEDTVVGGAGEDTVFAGDGPDAVYGGAGADSLFGDQEDDSLFGEAGKDTIGGGAGADIIFGGSGGDSIVGGIDDDTLFGEAGDDLLIGNRGNDLLNGNLGNDTLFGNLGNDVLVGNAGADLLRGYAGVDTFVITRLSQSRLGSRDHIQDFAIGIDILKGVNPVASIDIKQLGAVSALNEISLQQLLSETFEANSAATFTLGTRTFIALNDNVDGFSADSDAVIEITGFSGNLADLKVN